MQTLYEQQNLEKNRQVEVLTFIFRKKNRTHENYEY